MTNLLQSYMVHLLMPRERSDEIVIEEIKAARLSEIVRSLAWAGEEKATQIGLAALKKDLGLSEVSTVLPIDQNIFRASSSLEFKPKITVLGVGGAGGNAVNNMIETGLQGVDFVVANTDAQALTLSKAERIIQMGVAVTEGLGAGSQPEVGRAAAEEVIDEINDHLDGSHMVFITAGMGGGTGTGAAPVVARTAREQGILTIGVVTKPFHFEGQRRMRLAEAGIEELHKNVDTLIVIPNQNLLRIANEKTTFADAFSMADEVLYSGVACITDLMVKEGLINLDFADVRSVMHAMGKAMMGTGEASGEGRALAAAEAAIANPLLDDISMKGAQGLLISITGGNDLTLFEVDEAATRIREEVDPDANIILGATLDENMVGMIRVSVVATGTDQLLVKRAVPAQQPEDISKQFKIREPAYDSPYEQDHPAVSIAPFKPDAVCEPTVDEKFDAPKAVVEETVDAAIPFFPPAADVPANMHCQMRPLDDLPQIIQRELPNLRNRKYEVELRERHEHHDDEKRPMSLLKRLAAVGLGRSDGEHQHEARHAPPMQQPRQAPQQQSAQFAAHMGGQKVSAMPRMSVSAAPQTPKTSSADMPASGSLLNEFAPRLPMPDAGYQPRQGQLDAQERMETNPGQVNQRFKKDEDQIELPEFMKLNIRTGGKIS